RLLRAGELSPIEVPGLEQEALRDLSRVDRALVLLSLHRLSGDQVAWLEEFFADLPAGQEEELAAKVALNDVAPQVLLNLERHGIDPGLPPPLLDPWRQRRQQIQALAARRVAEAASLFRDFEAEGIEVIVLKGMLFAEVMWRDPAYKKMNDVDVLVRAEDVQDVRELYRARGYLPLVLFEGGDEEHLDLAKGHHLPSFVSPDLEFVVGTHWGLASPRKGLRLDHERMWVDSFELPFHGTRVRSLSHEDNLHHLAVHFHHYKTGIKELSDVYNYAAHAGEALDWDLLERRILAAGTASRAHYLFELAAALHPLGAPQSFFLALERAADEFARAEVRLRLSRLDLLTRSRSLYESTIEK
ncbi:MAG: nucleotidyltransferase family protein, partial [Myxococcales bacterium]|nr:nucleotidyltransferase family protein [Myxococcales bacterium]